MSDPFPFVPGFLLGYNRPEDTGPGYPQLTDGLDLTPPNLKSPFWGIRADRATAPVVFLFGREGMRALAVPPYTQDVGNGLRVCRKRGIGSPISDPARQHAARTTLRSNRPACPPAKADKRASPDG